jgi:hypothetical protein
MTQRSWLARTATRSLRSQATFLGKFGRVARIRSRLGFFAHVSVVRETRRGYTDVEREHLGAIAQLASHALSRARGDGFTRSSI